MLAKDAVSARLTSDAGISYTEFSYQLLQGNGLPGAVPAATAARLQTGGSDQWGNI